MLTIARASFAAVVFLIGSALLAPASGSAITLGAGSQPGVAVDAAGTAYVVWAGTEARNRSLRFCRLARRASRCDAGAARSISAPGDSTNVSRPFVFTPAPSFVVVFQYRFVTGVPSMSGVYRWGSSDGGRSFSPGSIVGSILVNDVVLPFPFSAVPAYAVSTSTPALTPGLPAGSVAFESVTLTGPHPPPAILSPGPSSDGTIAMIDTSTPLAAFVTNGQTSFRRYLGTGDLNNQANWTPAVDLGPMEHPSLAGGSKGLFVLGTKRNGLVVRRFTGATFGRPVEFGVGTFGGSHGHLIQDAGGRLHTTFPRLDRAGYTQLVHGWSDDGTTWRFRNLASGRRDPLFSGARIATAPDHLGVTVWSDGIGSRQRVRAARVTRDRPGSRRRPSLFGRASFTRSGSFANLSASAELAPPPGIPPAKGCRGKVKLSLLRGRTVRAAKTVRVTRDCNVSLRASVPAALVRGRGLRVRFAFSGNGVLKPVTIKKTLTRD